VNSILKSQNTSSLILRLGLAFVFLYAAVAALMHPLEWTGFLPGFLTKIFDPVLLLRLIAAFEIILGLGLLSGKCTKYVAALAAMTLAGIILTNLNQLIVTFRDVGLLCAALALVFLED